MALVLVGVLSVTKHIPRYTHRLEVLQIPLLSDQLPRFVVRCVFVLKNVDFSIFEQHSDAEVLDLRVRIDFVKLEEHRDVVVEVLVTVFVQFKALLVLLIQVVLGEVSSMRHKHVGFDYEDRGEQLAMLLNQLREEKPGGKNVTLEFPPFFKRLPVVDCL